MNTVIALWGFLLILLAALAGAGAFYITGNVALGVVPVALLGSLLLIPKLVFLKKPENVLLLYVGLVFFVDDAATKPWLEQTTITEQLAVIFFKTLPFNGNEITSFVLVGWIILRTRLSTWRNWIKSGFLTLMFTASILMFVHFFYVAYGVGTGGNLKDAFIQTRFNHLLPIWVLVGWGLISNYKIAHQMLALFALLLIFKGHQAIFNYYYHHSYYIQQEYLITHFSSAFIVLAVVYLIVYAVYFVKRRILRFCIYLNLIPLFLAFVFNDRRSAIIAIVFGFMSCVASLPFSTLVRFLRPLLKVSTVLGLYMAITWNMTGPIAALSAPIKSLFESPPNVEGPSSREIENFNLYSSITKHPYMGLGLGKLYDEIWELPNIDHIYSRNNMLPHNGLLFFWVFSGPLGIGAVGCFFTHLYFTLAHFFKDPKNKKAMAFGIPGMFFTTQYLVFIFADQSYHNNHAMFMIGMFAGGGARLLAEEKIRKAKEKNTKSNTETNLTFQKESVNSLP